MSAGFTPLGYHAISRRVRHPVATFSLISVIVFGLLALAAGVHLLALSFRTRKAPEFLLGGSFILSLLGLFGVLVVLGGDVDPEPRLFAWLQVSALVMNTGFLLCAFFNALVYRRGAVWAWALATTIALGLIGFQLESWRVGLAHWDASGLFWVKFALREVCYVWGALEAFRHYGLMRRQVRAGLASRVCANRLLLWGVATTFGTLILGAFEGARAAGFHSELGALLLTLGSGLGIPAAALFWLTFFAPASYRRQLGREPASAEVRP